MKNLLRYPADTLEMTAPSGGVVSGTAYLIGSIFGVAVADAAEGDPFSLKVQGEFTLPKNNAEATTQGQALYWDDTGKKLTTTAGSNKIVGAATVAHADVDTTQEIVLGYVDPT